MKKNTNIKKNNVSPEIKNAAKKEAILSGVFCGLGFIFQKQYIKGAIYMLVEVLAILLFVFWGLDSFNGLITLGTTPMVDHSLVLMIYGILAAIIFGAFIVFYVFGVVETYNNGIEMRNENYEEKSFKQKMSSWLHEKTPILFLFPGLVAIATVILLPLVFSICIGFTDYDSYHQPPAHIINWVGFKNFEDLLVLGQYAQTFFKIIGWTAIWTVCSSVLPYGIGIIIAVLLNNPRLKGKKIFKFIFILPWAIPGYITNLVLQTTFDYSSGLINKIIELLGGVGVRWLTSVTPARLSVILVSIWTGFSYPMMLSENIIKNIDKDIYEAATLDGASGTRMFLSMTLPLLMFSISPIFIMSIAGAFNNFNTIYLITGGGPLNTNYQSAGSTDTLITWLFKLTITNNKYNYGSAISIILFILVSIFSIFNLRKTKTFQEDGTLS